MLLSLKIINSNHMDHHVHIKYKIYSFMYRNVNLYLLIHCSKYKYDICDNTSTCFVSFSSQHSKLPHSYSMFIGWSSHFSIPLTYPSDIYLPVTHSVFVVHWYCKYLLLFSVTFSYYFYNYILQYF